MSEYCTYASASQTILLLARNLFLWQFLAIMKKLKKFLADSDVRQLDLATAINCHPSTVTRLLDGTLPDPKVSIAVAVEKFTGGAVKCEDWVK